MDNMSNQTPRQAPGTNQSASKKKKVILSVVGALVVVVIVIGTILTITHLNKASQSETPDPTPSQQIEPTISPEESDDTLNGIDNIVNGGVVDIEEIGPDGIILGKDKDGNQALDVLLDPDSEEFKKALAEAAAMLNAALKGEPLTPTTTTTPEQTSQPTPPPAVKPVTPPPATTDSGYVDPGFEPDDPYKNNTSTDHVIAPGTGDVAPFDPNSPANGLYWE